MSKKFLLRLLNTSYKVLMNKSDNIKSNQQYLKLAMKDKKLFAKVSKSPLAYSTKYLHIATDIMADAVLV